MITEWFISLGTGLTAWLGGLFDDIEVPEEFTDALQSVYDFLDNASGIGIWTPWLAIGIASAASVTVFGIAAGAMGVRQAAKHIPFVGGGG